MSPPGCAGPVPPAGAARLTHASTPIPQRGYMKLRGSLTVASFAFVIALPSLSAAQPLSTYHVTELPSPADRACVVTALNDIGVAAGACAVGGGVIWRDGSLVSLGLLSAGTYAAGRHQLRAIGVMRS